MNNEITTTDSKTVKPCVKCGAQDRNKRGACKPCVAERNRKWREANREKEGERVRKYRQANKDKIVEITRKYREDNKEKLSDYLRKWYDVNRENIAERSRKHYESNREKVLERQRKYREANREKVAEKNRKWVEANPQKVKVKDHNRRARARGNGGKLSLNIVQTLMELQNGKCTCCGKSLKNGHHLDHIMPLALGGTNTDDNVQLLTPSCNLRKGAKHPDDWARSNGRLL